MARSFNGSSDEISASLVTTTITGPVTLAGWAQSSNVGAGTRQAILSIGNGANGYAVLLSSGSSGVGPTGLLGGIAWVESSTPTVANKWYHIGFVLTPHAGGGSIDGFLYVNGSLAVSAPSLASAAIAPTGNTTIGTDTVGFLHGMVADAAVWNVGLSAGDFSGLYAGLRPSNVQRGSLIGYWPLDGLQSPEPDLSGNKNNGTLTGTALAFGPPFTLFTPRWPQFMAPPPPSFTLMPQIVT